MSNQKTIQNTLEDVKVNLKLQLAFLWTSLMFLYIYVDYFHLYMPGKMDDIQRGIVFKFDITQAFLLAALASMTIPALMIFLSVALPAKINRWLNVIIAVVFVPYTLFNLAGDTWTHMVFGAIIEVVLLCIIILTAWKWPHTQATDRTIESISHD